MFGELVLDFFIWAQDTGTPDTPAPSTLAETHLSPFLNDDLRDIIAAFEVGLTVGVEYGVGPTHNVYRRDFATRQRTAQYNAGEDLGSQFFGEQPDLNTPADLDILPPIDRAGLDIDSYARDPEAFVEHMRALDIPENQIEILTGLYRQYSDNEAGFQRFLKKLKDLTTVAPAMKLSGPQPGTGPDVPTDDWDYIFEAIRKRKRYQYARELLALIPGASV